MSYDKKWGDNKNNPILFNWIIMYGNIRCYEIYGIKAS